MSLMIDQEVNRKLTLTDKFIAWCALDTKSARFERSIAQGILSAIIVVVPQVLGLFTLPEWCSVFFVALIMSILAPIQKAIGNRGEIVEIEELNE